MGVEHEYERGGATPNSDYSTRAPLPDRHPTLFEWKFIRSDLAKLMDVIADNDPLPHAA